MELAILLAFGLIAWAALAIHFGHSRWLRIIHLAVLLVATIVAAQTTFNYEYFPNSNTKFCGWPVPYIIFQRENADSPWSDFEGWTLILAYPINLIIYLCVPAIVLLLVHYSLRGRTERGKHPVT